MPSEIVDVVVSLLCRMIFDFAVWGDKERSVPILMICEEAHRYAPTTRIWASPPPGGPSPASPRKAASTGCPWAWSPSGPRKSPK